MSYHAEFQCINSSCARRYPLDSIIYHCEHCGSLLEVVHNIDELKKTSAEAWKALFDKRYMKTEYPYGSGVWGKKEMVCPNVEDDNVVSLYEGGTNLLYAGRLGREIGVTDLWIKHCGNSHTGSFKDLGMTVLVSMVNQMRKQGKNIKAVACASTGDTSAALSAYTAMAEIPSIVLLPKDKISIAQLVQPIANGSIVLALKTDFDGCMSIVKEITKDNTIYLANSMNSLRIEGQKTVGMEIVQQFDWQVPDVIIIPGGNLGNVSALGNGFLLMQSLGIIDKMPRIVLAQAEKANPLYRSYLNQFKDFHPLKAEKTLASAIQIGNPVSIEKAIRVLKHFDGIVEQASEDELANAAARADRTGLFTCPHTAVALAALFKLADKGIISKNDRTVVISTAHGLKFSDFKVNYHTSALEGVTSTYANEPIELEANAQKVKDAIDHALDHYLQAV